MFRFCNAIFLSLIYTLLVFQSIVPIVDYQLNKKRIAETLCINKANVKKSCHGHCFLNKQITKAEESALPVSKSTSNSKIAVQDVAFNHLPENTFFLHSITIVANLIVHIEKHTLLYNHYTFSILRPPIV